MKTFFYTVLNSSMSRGYNQTIKVYRIKGNTEPEWIGSNYEITTASTKGEFAVASKIIADTLGHRMDKRGYSLESKNIQLFGL